MLTDMQRAQFLHDESDDVVLGRLEIDILILDQGVYAAFHALPERRTFILGVPVRFACHGVLFLFLGPFGQTWLPS